LRHCDELRSARIHHLVLFVHNIATTHVVETTVPACAMQTIFRLPWSTEPSSDEALAEKMYLHKQHRPKPRIEIPTLKDIKRKRVDSAESSPKHALHVKKLKSERDGAVQPSPVPPRGVDAVADFKPHVFSVNHDKPVKQECAGGNVGTFQVWKEKDPSTPGVTTPSISSPALAPTPATTDNVSGSAVDAFAITETAMADPDSNLDKLRAIIEAHINLEILHKHNELRLIDQELAKCQVSLEQLRRCELMPYPGSAGPSQAVTQGTGKSLKSPAGYTEPQYPAPWGVTDGPYARHYATWLLPDPAFDPWRANGGSVVGTPMTTRGNRANRVSPFDFHVPAPVARTSRTSTGNRQDSGNTSGRDPMIMKRQADGEWVRLRCSVCHRSNFNNIQGFLNHCRIAHHQDYKSHEQAAIACGEVVQVDEAAMAASESAAPTPIAPAPTPRVNSMPLPTPAPRSAVEFFPVTTPVEQPHVNSLIVQGAVHKPLDRVVDLGSTGSPKPTVARSSMKKSKDNQAPHLSNLMQRRGIPIEGLHTFMVDAKKKVDLSVYDVHSDSEHDHQDGKSKKSKQKKPKSNMQRAHSTPSATKQTSAKVVGRQGPTFAVMPPPPATGIGFHPSVFQHVIDTPSEEIDVEMELSPGTAPGLVSDHEDDFDDDDRSANGSHHHHDIHMEDIEIRDASDGERDHDRKPSSCESQVCSRQGAGIC